jgi:hypothetical protein
MDSTRSTELQKARRKQLGQPFWVAACSGIVQFTLKVRNVKRSE